MRRTAWEAVMWSVAESPYPVTVLEPDHRRAAELGIAADSWLGAVVAHSGGLLVDGRLRVFGSGFGSTPAVHAGPVEDGGFVVADTVRGDCFALVSDEAGRRAIHHLAPGLGWENLRLGYTNWLGAMLAGSLDER
ncbi:DUF2625 family protein [Lentzea sp. NPDC058436]|uniref:DUF2625 family protein n=1 Tax=Lentzea sp. NPDC058436 TaxID=3346499 RepID=UPI00365C957E